MSSSHRVGSLGVIPALMHLIVAVKSRVLFAEENVIKAGEINGAGQVLAVCKLPEG